MSAVCTRCGQPCAEPGARFCPSCGGALNLEAPAAPAAPLLSGARCALHPVEPARDICSRCGNFACSACVQLDAAGQPLCASCAARSAVELPWEHRKELGLFQAYWRTAKLLAFSPQLGLGAIKPHGEWWDAMSFGLMSYVCSVSGTLVLYAGIFGSIGLAALFGSSAHTSGAAIAGIFAAVVLGLLVVIPISAFIRIYVGVLIDHLALRLAGGHASFDTTFRAYCYAMSPSFFGLIPGCGVYVVEIWRLVLSILAYKQVHRISGGRATAAVLIPVGLCCAGYFALVFGVQMATLARH